MAIVSNSIEAIDRVLETFGFEGELEGKTPRAARVILFYRNELREWLLASLGRLTGRYRAGAGVYGLPVRRQGRARP